MALKGDMTVLDVDISRSCSTVAERGTILFKKTAGSGVALGDSAGVCELLAANTSGNKVHGMLWSADVVNVDQTRYHLNFQKDEVIINGKVGVVRKGRLTTNKVTGTPTDGATAYAVASGLVSPTVDAVGGIAMTPKVGEFIGIKDENGYVTVDLDLPVV